MPTPGRPIRLEIERERIGPDGIPERIRLTMELPVGDDDTTGLPSTELLRQAIDELRATFHAAVEGSPSATAIPRELEELVETYRPRQLELIDLLRNDGEISAAEAERLRGYLAAGAPALGTVALRTEPAPLPPPLDRPLAAIPLENDRTPSVARPIPDLLQFYRIETLKQAGAVRARRQISYDEYMALKRHFAAAEALAARAASAEGGQPPPAAP